MKCLLTSRGFIGSHLEAKLRVSGHQVIILPRGWKKLPKCDVIYHLAAYGNMNQDINEEEMFQTNVINTWNLLQASKGIKRFVYISTSSVTLPVQTLYSRTKRMGEIMCENFKNVVIIRPYSVTGVGEQKEHLIPILINAAFTGKKIPFVGQPTHDFIDVEDVVKAMITIKKPGIYNIGSGFIYSNADVKKLIEEVTGKKIKTLKMKPRVYDNRDWKSPEHWATKQLWESISEMVNEYSK